jgi:hypothetical protein
VSHVSESILTSTKKALDISETISVFDANVIMYINTAFSTLNQIGIGPSAGYMISGIEETWDAFIGDDPRLNSVKTYVYLKVRLLFDPPQTSFLLEAFKAQIQELEWRLNVKREGEEWDDPFPISVTNDEQNW